MEKEKWNWRERLIRVREKWRSKRERGVLTADKSKERVLTMENTVATLLTDYDPHMLTLETQTGLVDWDALEPQTRPQVHVGYQNWPGVRE